jgi:putative transposase
MLISHKTCGMGDLYAFRRGEEMLLSFHSYACKTGHIWYNICIDRTIRIQLHPTPEQAQALKETLCQFTYAFNLVCAYGWQHHEKNGVRLHHDTYYQTKEQCPGLVSDLLIQARVKATETLKSAFTWKQKQEQAYPKKVAKALKRGKPAPVFKPVHCPHSTSCPARYIALAGGQSGLSSQPLVG